MTYWIFSWKKAIFDLHACLKDYGYLEWRQHRTPNVGDIVFIYAATPIKQIMFMAKVTAINIPYAKTINKNHLTQNYGYKLKPTDYYFRMEIISTSDLNNKELSYSRLCDNGLKSTLQSPTPISGQLLSHILDNFDVVFDNDTQNYLEGAAVRHSIISYERNQFAKEECLNHYGYICQICNTNLEKVYGEVGKNFIHVHHVDFISSFGGVEHEIEPISGLIPVCPNCHAMLHRKVNGQYLTPEQLKKLVSH